MRRFLIFLFAAGCLAVLPTAAQEEAALPEGRFGAGIIIGEPTGFSGKYWFNETSAVDLALAWSFYGGGEIYVHGDYLHHMHDLLVVTRGSLPVYFGAGLKAKIWSSENKFDEGGATLTLRIPVGISYLFDEYPLELFVEIVPGFEIVPDFSFDPGGGVGIRYYF